MGPRIFAQTTSQKMQTRAKLPMDCSGANAWQILSTLCKRHAFGGAKSLTEVLSKGLGKARAEICVLHRPIQTGPNGDRGSGAYLYCKLPVGAGLSFSSRATLATEAILSPSLRF